ncbi:MAG: hypothetical protein ACI3XY_04570 [Butyricicoccaceae bacterium]
MKAVKGNRVYTIEEAQKQFYCSRGFDITDDRGSILQHGRGKTVPYEQYADVVAERDALKAKEKPKKSEAEKTS